MKIKRKQDGSLQRENPKKKKPCPSSQLHHSRVSVPRYLDTNSKQLEPRFILSPSTPDLHQTPALQPVTGVLDRLCCPPLGVVSVSLPMFSPTGLLPSTFRCRRLQLLIALRFIPSTSASEKFVGSWSGWGRRERYSPHLTRLWACTSTRFLPPDPFSTSPTSPPYPSLSLPFDFMKKSPSARALFPLLMSVGFVWGPFRDSPPWGYKTWTGERQRPQPTTGTLAKSGSRRSGLSLLDHIRPSTIPLISKASVTPFWLSFFLKWTFFHPSEDAPHKAQSSSVSWVNGDWLGALCDKHVELHYEYIKQGS